ncbi:MAG: glycosyl hydrolase-related protein [Planctomycetota bacterium]
MKIAYIHLLDHQDPIWNKAFARHVTAADGAVIRSYSEREEMQFDRWVELLAGTPAVLEIEQASTLRAYLRRNPERLEPLRRLVADGRVVLLGGGEAIIDTNLVGGEAIYRNLLLGLRWMRETFGAIPTVSDTNDTFGLSAQMPQILAQFGFRWNPIYSRMFGHETVGMETEHVRDHPARPYWRGLDGTLICIKRNFADDGVPDRRAMVNYQYRPCPECRGEGCRFCEHVGLDRHITHDATSMETALAALAASDHAAMRIFSTTEETVRHPTFVDDALALGERYGVEVRFVSHADLLDTLARPYVAELAAGTVGDDAIDWRTEGNPIGTGCYTTRGILKRENRAIEHLLLAAERFAVMAAALGMAYPGTALAELWRMLNLTQAHDALTGNHPDGPFAELRTLQRTVRLGAGKRLLAACRLIAAHIDAPAGDGAVAVAVFNAATWPVARSVADVVIPADAVPSADPQAIVGWTAATAGGEPLTVLEHKAVTIKAATVHRLQCVVGDLPACGYTTILCRPLFGEAAPTAPAGPAATSTDAEAAGLQADARAAVPAATGTGVWRPVDGGAIENDRYRIDYGPRGVTGIVDKTLGKIVAGAGTCDLWAEDDVGSFWETLKRFDRRVNLNAVADVSAQAYAHADGTARMLVIRGSLPERRVWDLPAAWSQVVQNSRGGKIRDLTADEVEVVIDALRWEIQLRLIDGDGAVGIRAAVDCDSRNIRLRLPFVLGFTTAGDRAVYEIPYGILERPSYTPLEGTHTNPGGTWPAVHWAAAVNAEDDYTCAILNRGVAAYRFAGGVMDLTLLRSPRLSVWNPRPLEVNRRTDPLATDAGEQVFELAFTSGAGDVAANRLVRRGWAFNSTPTAVALAGAEIDALRRRTAGAERLAGAHSFLAGGADNVLITAIKQAEDGDDVVLRLVEAYGRAAEIPAPSVFGAPTCEVSALEDDPRPAGKTLRFRPFEIKTLRTCR